MWIFQGCSNMGFWSPHVTNFPLTKVWWIIGFQNRPFTWMVPWGVWTTGSRVDSWSNPASSGILPDICNEPSGILIPPQDPGIVPLPEGISRKKSPSLGVVICPLKLTAFAPENGCLEVSLTAPLGGISCWIQASRLPDGIHKWNPGHWNMIND